MNNRNLTNKSRLERGLIAAVLALLFAGSATAVAASALGVAVSAATLYGAAFVAAALCVAGTLSGGAVLASLGFVAVAGLYLATHGAGLTGLKALFASWAGQPAQAARAAEGGRLLLTCAGFTLGVLFFALLNHGEFVSVAIVLLLGVLVACHAMSESASLGAAVPGLVGAAAAFALTGDVQRDFRALRVLAPAAVALAVAVALVPGNRLTWKPLEDAAERVRGMFEQYFRFTHERVAFSINEEGYDHAGEVGDAVVSMLGGPAEPRTDAVMRVHTNADALLRGAIRTAYTGYSWVDTVPKNRYLYYDITHRATRERLFSAPEALEDAILRTDVSVEMLSEGTSTLFVPGMMDGFQMDLSTAVYYNSAGEVFLSRDVQRGDGYRLRALLPEMNEALRRAAIEGENAGDDRYQDILDAHIRLPEGIDGGVYTLTMRVIEGAQTAWDRAVAIMDYLRGNMRYTLKPDMPPRGRDFVSHFLLDTREGYCSYYASGRGWRCSPARTPTPGARCTSGAWAGSPSTPPAAPAVRARPPRPRRREMLERATPPGTADWAATAITIPPGTRPLPARSRTAACRRRSRRTRPRQSRGRTPKPRTRRRRTPEPRMNRRTPSPRRVTAKPRRRAGGAADRGGLCSCWRWRRWPWQPSVGCAGVCG